MWQYNIRYATDGDRSALEQLWRYAFAGDGAEFTQWYFEKYAKMDEILVLEADGHIAASAQMIHQTLNRHGEILPVRYIVGVDCYPEYRGYGAVRALIQYMFQEAVAGLYLLMPFEADFYRAYDFVFFHEHGVLDLPMDEVIPLGSKGPYRAQQHSLEQSVDFGTVYDGWQRRYFDYYQERDERRWDSVLTDLAMEDGKALVLYDESMPVGYLLYRLTENAFWIREMAYINETVRAQLYYLMAGHRSQVHRVQWSAPLQEPLVQERSRDKQGVHYEPFMMLRVIDPKVASFFANGHPKEAVCFEITDRDRGWKQTYRWDDNGIQESVGMPDFQMTVGEWAALMTAKVPFARLIDRLGERLYHEQAFQHCATLFSPSDIYLNEYF